MAAPLEGMSALIFDANVTHRRLIGKLLREQGCTKIHETADAKDADDLFGITLGNLDMAFISADLPRIPGAGLVKMMRLGKTQGDRNTPCLIYHPLADDALKLICGDLYAGVMTVPVSAQDFLNLVFDTFDLAIPADRDVSTVSIKWQPKVALAIGTPADAVYVNIAPTQPPVEAAKAAVEAAKALDNIEMRLADGVTEDCTLVRPLIDRTGQPLAAAGEVVTAEQIGIWVRSGKLVPSSRLYILPDRNPAKKSVGR